MTRMISKRYGWRALTTWIGVVATIACPIGCGSSSTSDAPKITYADAPQVAAPAAKDGTAVSDANQFPLANNAPAVTADPEIPKVGARWKTADSKAGEIALSVADAQAYQATIEKHKGKVVLVDFWATWCPECMTEFRHTVELSHKWKEKGLVAVSVALDDASSEKSRAKAIEFLQQQNAAMDNLISQQGASVDSFVSFDIVGSALPFYKLYDRSGKLRYQFTYNVSDLQGVSKTDEMDKRVEELLGEGA